jgi:lipoate-protein ligase A
MDHVRLLIDPPAPGAWNMAVDEALLESAAGGQATLRFYEWDEPTLSLGYFQAAAARDEHAASRNCPLVRRGTGGGAIVHDRELTYSIALPQATLRRTAAELYDLFHETLVQTLAEFGVAAAMYKPEGNQCETPLKRPSADPFLCFERRSCGDIVSGDKKIVGSAQRRSRGAVLQHGSILLARSDAAPELAGIQEVAGISIPPEEVAARWLPRLAMRLGQAAKLGDLTPHEREQVRHFVACRYAADDFVNRR